MLVANRHNFANFEYLKNRLHILTLALSCLVSACGLLQKNESEVPKGILSPSEFRDVLVDFALAESASNLNIRSVKPDKLDSAYSFNPLKDRGLRQSQYDSSVQYYSAHPKLYRAVYDSVLTTLNDYRLSREKIKRDSLSE